MNKLTAPLVGDTGAPVTADLGIPLSPPSPAMPACLKNTQTSQAIQVFAGVPKDCTEQELHQLFSSVPGMQTCKMLLHQNSGLFEVRTP